MEKLELRAGRTMRMRSPRKSDFSAAKKARFLAALAATCNVRAACRSARVSERTVYRHRQISAPFRARWAEAVREAYGRLELMLLDRMMNGTVTTRTRHDGSIDRTHEFPNAIALTLLRLHRDASAEATAEREAIDADELRAKIARRIERLRERIARNAPGQAEE